MPSDEFTLCSFVIPCLAQKPIAAVVLDSCGISFLRVEQLVVSSGPSDFSRSSALAIAIDGTVFRNRNPNLRSGMGINAMSQIDPVLASFFAGAALSGYLVIALFFFRFWIKSRDSLFLTFFAAFLLLACNSLAPLLLHGFNDQIPAVYSFRLTAFVLIILGISQKNI